MTGFWGGVAALLPPVGVGLIFWVAMRAIVHADRRERAAMARLEAEEDAAARAAGAPGRADAGADGDRFSDPEADPSARAAVQRRERNES